MPKKVKPKLGLKRKPPAKSHPKEDVAQAAYRVLQEVIRRSQS